MTPHPGVLFGLSVCALVLTRPASGQGRRGGGSSPGSREPTTQLPTAPARGGGVRTGSVTGRVTAQGPKGETIKAAKVLVQLWTTDGTTSAARDAACSAWLSDKTVWLQAKQEIESPSEMNLAGTPVGHDVELLHSLMALRRDTARTNSDGDFTFNKVPFGAYTVEAEVYANDKFVQWSKDVGVIPGAAARADARCCGVSGKSVLRGVHPASLTLGTRRPARAVARTRCCLPFCPDE